MNTTDTNFSEGLINIRVKSAVIAELIKIVPELNENTSKTDLLLAQRLLAVIDAKTAEVASEHANYEHNITMRVSQLEAEIEKYKNGQ